MQPEQATEGITPDMIRLGLLRRNITDLAADAYRIECEIQELLYEKAPAHLTGEPIGNDQARDAFWERFNALVDEAEKAREEADDA